MTPSLDQARARYQSRTRGILTKPMRKSCDAANWSVVDGFPCLVDADGGVLMHFRIDPSNRRTFAVLGHPNLAK